MCCAVDGLRVVSPWVSSQGHKYPGFLGSLLEIVAHRDGLAGVAGSTEFFTRQQAAIVFKRLVERGWDLVGLGSGAHPIMDADRTVVRSGIVQVSECAPTSAMAPFLGTLQPGCCACV